MKDQTLAVGDRDSLRKTMTEADVVIFSGMSLDTNPVHIDALTARDSRFGGRIVHGMLVSSLISAVIGTRLPGAGTIYMEQSLRFVKPVPVGATVEAQVEVVEILPRGRVRLATNCVDEDGDFVVEGEALVLVPSNSR